MGALTEWDGMYQSTKRSDFEYLAMEKWNFTVLAEKICVDLNLSPTSHSLISDYGFNSAMRRLSLPTGDTFVSEE